MSLTFVTSLLSPPWFSLLEGESLEPPCYESCVRGKALCGSIASGRILTNDSNGGMETVSHDGEVETTMNSSLITHDVIGCALHESVLAGRQSAGDVPIMSFRGT